MDWKSLFLSFDGRIGRKAYWIGTFALVALILSLHQSAIELFSLPVESMFEQNPVNSAVSIAISLATLWPSLAVLVKRLHDRNWSGWWAAPLYVFTLGFDAADLAGLTGTLEEPSLAGKILLWSLGLIALVYLVELGFRKGTPGPNRFGPDPLSAAHSDASF